MTRLAGIISWGASIPDAVLTNFDLEKIVLDTSDAWIRTRTGISRRHIADADKPTSYYAALAAKQALERIKMNSREIGLVIVATVTGDYRTPATASIVQHLLGATNAGAMDVSAGCTGWVYAMATANAFVASEMYDHVLVIGADELSRITDYTKRETCVLLGDGAGVSVVSADCDGNGILATYLRSDGSNPECLYIPAGGSKTALTNEGIADGLDKLYMDGNKVFRFAVNALCDAINQLCSRAGLLHGQLDLIVPHQANIRIVEAAAKTTGIPLDRFYTNLAEVGNTSAASIPIALNQAYQEGRIRKGMRICTPGFGAGLTWGGVIFRAN